MAVKPDMWSQFYIKTVYSYQQGLALRPKRIELNIFKNNQRASLVLRSTTVRSHLCILLPPTKHGLFILSLVLSPPQRLERNAQETIGHTFMLRQYENEKKHFVNVEIVQISYVQQPAQSFLSSTLISPTTFPLLKSFSD